MCMYMVAK